MLTNTTPPPARGYPAVANDSVRQRIIVFGGISTGSAALGDTWMWDGTRWSQHSGPGPSARYNHGMVYDSARQRVVQFGATVNDTWELGLR